LALLTFFLSVFYWKKSRMIFALSSSKFSIVFIKL